MGWMDRPYDDGVHSCKDCTEREVGCHSRCEKYINAKKDFNKRRSEIRKVKKQEQLMSNFYDYNRRNKYS